MSIPLPDSEDLTIKCPAGIIGGWTSLLVDRGVDMLPSSFSVETTEKEPNDPLIAAIKPGDAVQVYLGADLILTGYLNVDGPHIDKENHTIALAGRSKTQDLVDCSIVPGHPDSQGNVAFQSWQVQQSTIGAASAWICKPFGITALTPDGDVPLPAGFIFSVQPGMTCFQLIEQIARATQMLIWDNPAGNLVLSKASNVGAVRAASGLIEGQNIEVGEARLSDDQRFSDIYVLAQDAVLGTDELLHWNPFGHSIDPDVLRFRPHAVIIDAAGSDPTWPQRYADWEMRRRKGRAQQRIALVTGWRDGAGTLWTPNTTVNVSSPTLKSSSDKVIARCVWMRGPQGTQTRIITMPADGLSLEPIRPPQPVPGAVPAPAASTALPHASDAI
jgi:prophage tail gpP-like protein